MLNLVFITGGIARRQATTLLRIHDRMRSFERDEKIRLAARVGNDKTEARIPWKFTVCKELQGSGALVPPSFLVLHSQVGPSKKVIG